jgi:hypothetical protein
VTSSPIAVPSTLPSTGSTSSRRGGGAAAGERHRLDELAAEDDLDELADRRALDAALDGQGLDELAAEVDAPGRVDAAALDAGQGLDELAGDDGAAVEDRGAPPRRARRARGPR